VEANFNVYLAEQSLWTRRTFGRPVTYIGLSFSGPR